MGVPHRCVPHVHHPGRVRRGRVRRTAPGDTSPERGTGLLQPARDRPAAGPVAAPGRAAGAPATRGSHGSGPVVQNRPVPRRTPGTAVSVTVRDGTIGSVTRAGSNLAVPRERDLMDPVRIGLVGY